MCSLRLCLVFGAAHRLQVPWPGVAPGPRHWQREVLATGPAGKSVYHCIFYPKWDVMMFITFNSTSCFFHLLRVVSCWSADTNNTQNAVECAMPSVSLDLFTCSWTYACSTCSVLTVEETLFGNLFQVWALQEEWTHKSQKGPNHHHRRRRKAGLRVTRLGSGHHFLAAASGHHRPRQLPTG